MVRLLRPALNSRPEILCYMRKYANYALNMFPIRVIPTLSIPILSIPIWSMLTKRELTKWELTKWEVNEVGRFTI